MKHWNIAREDEIKAGKDLKGSSKIRDDQFVATENLNPQRDDERNKSHK